MTSAALRRLEVGQVGAHVGALTTALPGPIGLELLDDVEEQLIVLALRGSDDERVGRRPQPRIGAVDLGARRAAAVRAEVANRAVLSTPSKMNAARGSALAASAW